MDTPDRRRHRSTNLVEALKLQLGSSCSFADLDALVLADEDGLCVASAGVDGAAEDIAAHAAVVGHKVENFEGVLFSSEQQWSVRIRRFRIGVTQMFLCAVGGGGETRAQTVHDSIGGVSRILAV
jgi:hypothetical protein